MSVVSVWHDYIKPRLVTRKILPRILFPAIALATSIVILSPLLFPQGLPFYGDETYYIPWIPSTVVRYNLLVWTSGNGPTSNILSLFPTLILIGLSGILGQDLGVKGYLLLMAWLTAILPYVATKQLLRHWKLSDDPRRIELAAAVSGLASLLFFYNQATVAGSNSFVWNYSLFAILVSSLVIFVDTGRIGKLLAFGVFSALASVQPFWPFLVGTVGLMYLVFALLRNRTIRGAIRLFRNSLLAVATALGFNAFWIVPIGAGYVLKAGGGSNFQLYGTSGAVSFGDLSFLSFWSLKDILLMGESAHYFFWSHPQNYTLLSFILPVIAATAIAAYRRTRAVFYVLTVLVVGVFATAGTNEPIGSLYYQLTIRAPYGAGAILRNPTKFVPIVTFAYGLLLGLGVIAVGSVLTWRRLPHMVSGRRIVRWSIVLVLVLLILAPITYGTLLDLQGYTYPRYSPTNIPPQYGQMNNWLSAQPGDYKVMWIPAGGAYDWKQYAITAFPDLLSSKPTVPFSLIYPDPLSSTNNIGRVLAFTGVKYIVYHGDSLNFPNDQILQELQSQRDLTPVASLNGTESAIDNSHAPLPVGASGTSFGNSPFSLSTTDLLRGSDNLTMHYTIPQSVIDQGYTGGQFADYFGIALHGFPSGSVNFDNRVFFATVAHQDMVNNTTGYASFNVTTSVTDPETSIDLYANYYDSGFRPLTPIYYIARLTYVPSQVINRYIIFENRDFIGQVFSQSLSVGNSNVTSLLKSNSNVASFPLANLTDYQQTSGVEFKMTVTATSPFFLILTEPYDLLWTAYVGDNAIQPTQIIGLVNGFLIPPTGSVSIRIYYTLQNYQTLGWILTAETIAGFVAAGLLIRRRKRKELALAKSVVPVPIPAQASRQPWI